MSANLDRIKKLIADHLDTTPDQVSEQSRLVDDLGADSLDHVELVMLAEEEFDITISDDEAERLKTIGDVLALVNRRMGVPA